MLTPRFYITGLFCCLFPIFNFAQKQNQFPENGKEFMQELEVFMTKSNHAEQKKVFENFSAALHANPLSEEEFRVIHAVCNAMLSKKMNASPHFKTFLNSIVIVREKGSPNHFIAWQNSLLKLVDGLDRKKDFITYLEFTNHFFTENTLRYSKSGINWKVSESKFKIQSGTVYPEIHFEKATLSCIRKNNVIKLENTTGFYLPVQEKWKAVQAEVSFKRAGLENVFAKIKDFEIDCSKGYYKTKNAFLIHPDQFGSTEIEGGFEDKLLVENKKIEKSYPRFESNSVTLNLNHLHKQMNMKGGVKFHGAKMYIYGNSATPVVMKVYDENNTDLKFKAKGQFFAIKEKEGLHGEMAEATLYFEKDSLYHPSANLRFDFKKNELNLSKGERGSGQNPFYDSYHKMLLHTDHIDCFLNNDSVVINQKNLLSGNSGQNVTFESLNFFDIKKYLRLQNIASKNPIALLKQISEMEDSRKFKAIVLAQEINPDFDLGTIRSLLADLAAYGFIDYNEKEKTILVKEKTFLYADAAVDKTDYDVLHFASKSNRTNAVLDLHNKEITTRDVKHITFSQSQKVAGKPDDGKVVVRKNRNLYYDGNLYAGYGRLNGKNFNFVYDEFKVDMDSVLFFDLFVPTEKLDENNEPIAYSISSRIENLTGTLFIDDPENKSGKEDFEKYPSFTSDNDAFVYYDYEGTQNGAYSRDSFYFKLNPFTFDKLDDFNAGALNFSGTMFPAGIFPPFDENILLQEDQSLGFTHRSPVGGYDTYQQKGKFSGAINLSNKGFIANGNVKYMQASIDSEEIIFMPAQMLTAAEQFQLAEDRKAAYPVPEVMGYDVEIDWQPYKDSMYIVSKEKPFQLFKGGNHTLERTLILTPQGLKGRGIYDWEKAKMESQLYAFDANAVQTDTACLQIKAIDSNEMALETSNVFAELNFDEEMGYVKSNIDTLTTSFPVNLYKSSMNEFEWNMKEELLTFKATDNNPGDFFATAAEQKGLQFQGLHGVYNLRTNKLNVSGVENIIVSDAYIFPDSGLVEIQKRGIMTRLENAKIVADTINQNHVINKAIVDVIDKETYHASGFYEYNIAGKEQEIEFANIRGEAASKKSNSVTTAAGEINTEDFYIDDKTRFKGAITLVSDDKNLTFNGFGQLDAKFLPKQEWFTINCKGDKSDLKISLNDVKSYHGVELKTGLYLRDYLVYPLVMMERHRKTDRCIFDASGLLDYDKENQRFIIGDSLKMVNGTDAGNKLIFDDKDGSLKMEGHFNIGAGLQYVGLELAGKGEATFTKTDSDEGIQADLAFELLAALDLKIPQKILSVITSDLQSTGYDAEPIAYHDDFRFYEKALSELVQDDKALFKTCNGLRSSNRLKLSGKKNKTDFLLGKMNMVWHADLQSFISQGDKIAVGSINGESVDRMLEAYLEVRMPANEDDRIYFYFKTPGDLYYFFGFKQGILSIGSNNTRIPEAFEKLKKKELTQKMDDGEYFEIQLVEENDVNRFLSRVKS